MYNKIFTVLLILFAVTYISLPSSRYVFSTLIFALAIIAILTDIYKLTFGKRHLNNLKGIKKYIFSEEGDKIKGFFAKETLFSAKGTRLFWVWFGFLFSVGYVIWYAITYLILK